MTEPLAYTISEACKAAAISRSELYRRMRLGEIVPRRRGCRTIIVASDLKRFVEGLPPINLAAHAA